MCVPCVVSCRNCITTMGRRRRLKAIRGKSQDSDTNCKPKTTIIAKAASKQAMPVRWPSPSELLHPSALY